jgi:hypothetical protein
VMMVPNQMASVNGSMAPVVPEGWRICIVAMPTADPGMAMTEAPGIAQVNAGPVQPGRVSWPNNSMMNMAAGPGSMCSQATGVSNVPASGRDCNVDQFESAAYASTALPPEGAEGMVVPQKRKKLMNARISRPDQGAVPSEASAERVSCAAESKIPASVPQDTTFAPTAAYPSAPYARHSFRPEARCLNSQLHSTVSVLNLELSSGKRPAGQQERRRADACSTANEPVAAVCSDKKRIDSAQVEQTTPGEKLRDSPAAALATQTPSSLGSVNIRSGVDKRGNAGVVCNLGLI